MRSWTFADLPLAPRLFCAFALGAMGALGQAPFDMPIFMLLALAAGFILWRNSPEHPFVTGWMFGTGYFALALVWIVEPFQVDAARHGWMAPFALLFLSTGLALFWGGAFWLARTCFARSFALVLCWTAVELVRAYIFTGFPWASPAQVSINGPASVGLALGGPHGVNLVMICLAWLLSYPASNSGRIHVRLGQGALLGAGFLALTLPDTRPVAEASGHQVRLIQPNAAQNLKWRPDMAEVFFQRQLAYTRAPPEEGMPSPDLIVWSETAIPWRLETARPALVEISEAAGGTPVALGALRYENADLRNALAVVEAEGVVGALYDKHHLVPFGEYIPFARWAGKFGLRALATNASGFTAGPGPALLDFGSVGKALPLICYEAVFAHDVNAMPDRADFLLQVTNDAWFGQNAGPQQHLAQARMRAIEQGLPLMRAANTGITAMIDPFGRVVARLDLNTSGFLDAALPAPRQSTIYSRVGDGPIIFIVVFGALAGIFCVRFEHYHVNN